VVWLSNWMIEQPPHFPNQPSPALAALNSCGAQVFAAPCLSSHLECATRNRSTHPTQNNQPNAAEFEEWGNPKDPVYYQYMKSYSPVDNVKAQR